MEADNNAENISSGLKFLVCGACFLILANIYYAQPIITDIALSLGIGASASGIVMTTAQIGYCLGVLFIVPLGDLVENRLLISFMVALVAAALCLAAFSAGAYAFLAAKKHRLNGSPRPKDNMRALHPLSRGHHEASGLEDVGRVLAKGVILPGDITGHPAMDEAKRLGESIT